MEQFEQLLTCAICLDRYKNPKLLPCQHSFCMEPCMDGLVDYVRRQVKCPECRAEHRIPYQGVQGFPTNVTLQRFLELHIEITGELPDPTSGQIMERCGVCSEKAYCAPCVHCDKKICADCKGAHMDILRREIARINNQVRRALHRLQDALGLVEKNTISLQVNCSSVAEEVDEIYRRLAKALKDRTEFLRVEVDRYLCTELRNLGNLKENLETEISNITSNCDLADKHMTDSVEWDDCELMDAKEIFLKTVEFIRNFEYENADYNRRVRFAMAHDPNQLVLHVAGYGELNINMPHQAILSSAQNNSALLQPPGAGPGLMRSKSDHRLATQFRQQEERGGYGDRDEGERGYGGDALGGRKFGERYPNRSSAQVGYEAPTSRYGRTQTNDYPEFESPYDNESRPRRYRSRFARHADDGGSDNDQGTGRSVRFSGADKEREPKERERVLDTEDVAKGPLSGISRLYDSPRVMKRLQEVERGKREKKEPAVVQPPQPKPLVQVKAAAGVKKAARQVSEEDEIAKIKKQNKSGPSTETATPPPPAPVVTRPPEPVRKTPVPEVEPEAASSDESEEEAEPVSSLQRKTTPAAASKPATDSRRSSASSDVAGGGAHKKAARSASSDSSTSSESSTGSSKVAHTGAAYTTEEVKQKILARGSIDKGTTAPADVPAPAPTPRSRPDPTPTPAPTPARQPFQSRFLGAGRPTPQAAVEKKEESESSSEEETSSEEESDDDAKPPAKPTSTASSKMEKTDIGPLLARSAQARDTTAEDSRKNSRDETEYKSRYGSPTTKHNDTNTAGRFEAPRSRFGSYGKEEPAKYGRKTEEETTPPRYGSAGYTSRFLNKSKSSAALSPDEEVEASLNRKYGPDGEMAKKLDETRYPSGRTRYAALKDRRSRLSRSKSSHNFGGEDGDEEDPAAMPASYMASRYGPGSSASSSAIGNTGGSDLARSRSTHALKPNESSPERAGAGGEKDGAALSSWARYLKNKYGNRKDAAAGAASPSAGASATASRRLSMGLPLRNSLDSSDDDQKNSAGSPTSPTAAQAAGFAAAGTTPRSQYLAKRRQQFKIGERGSEAGCFTWPRGIAVAPDNTIVVADSSNHRVQVFDSHGIFVKEFGSYGNGEGEFDCLAGVAVNRIGQYIIADRYNHRIQVLDPSGRFLRAFGSQGTADGRFNYPWGITTDALGFIYVCDKENHRVQVFQSDGMFVGKFGSCGNKPGQLEHPHYIAVSSTNRVIVSDSNNHRVQIFDVNGRVLTTFGSEGSEEGQFKFPRGVAVDDQGYICVADSGNNRIQIFHPDGTFLRAFGCWGSGEGEFKGLEGVAVMSNGNILVCDRENHRVQVF